MFPLELGLKSVLLAEVHVILHVVLGKLAGAWAPALRTVRYFALGVRLRLERLLHPDIPLILWPHVFFPILVAATPFMKVILLLLLAVILEDDIAGFILVDKEKNPRSLELVEGTVRNQFYLKEFTQIIEYVLDLALPLAGATAIPVELLQDGDEALIDLMVPGYHLFEVLSLFLLHELEELRQMLVHGLRIGLLHEALVEDDLFGDLKIVLEVLRIIHLEAQLEQLIVEPPQHAIHEHPVVPHLLHDAVLGDEVEVERVGESRRLREYLAIVVGEQARQLLVVD